MTHTSAAATRKTRRPRRDHHIITSLTGRARRETETREPRAREQTESERHERGDCSARDDLSDAKRERERERERRERERERERTKKFLKKKKIDGNDLEIGDSIRKGRSGVELS